MTDEILLFFLRLLISVVLLLFLGVITWMLWRDYRQIAFIVHERTRARGRLVVLASQIDSVPVGQTFPLLPLTSLGRAPTNTVQLSESFISNEHALVQWREGQWWLEDLNSSNGTLLNDIPLKEAAVISSGDVAGLGSVRLRLELE